MSITDELREYAQIAFEKGSAGHARFETIADRIDAEHEADVSTACRLATGLDNDALSKRGYIALPVDADGVPIRPGDALTIVETGEHIRAFDIELYDDWRWCVCDYETMDSINPDRLRHRPPTVEDVLDEFFGKANLPDGTQTRAEIIAEYAARLRLAEGAGACRE